MLDGLIASDGIAIGQALILNEVLRVPDYSIRTADVKLELLKFDAALAIARDQLVDLKDRNKNHEKTCKILESQLLMLVDPLFVSEVIQKLRSEKRNVERVVSDVIAEFSRSFRSMDNDYLKERAVDVQDVGQRILRNLLGQEIQSLESIPNDTVLVCHVLTPSDMARLDTSKLAGICCEEGGINGHAAILARALMIPALMGVEGITEQVKNGDRLILDCINGKLRLDPSEEDIEEFQELQQQLLFSIEERQESVSGDAVSVDGVELTLRANISVPAEIAGMKTFGAEGVGLYRTEYLFLKSNSLPPPEEQLAAYKKVASGCAPFPATIRTLDIGGDKDLPYLGIPSEANPAMGDRSIRYCLQNQDVFRTQLRAILQASTEGSLRILYPMITVPEELTQANQILDEVKQELSRDGVPFDADIPIGAMIEVPSAALTVDLLAPQVDFLSIGTNDLMQFTLAVDRSNQRLSSRFDFANVALARLIRNVVDQGAQAGIDVSCCGEMAGTPIGFLMLLGLGIRDFSMNLFSVPRIKQMINRIEVAEVERVVNDALSRSTSEQIRNKLDQYLQHALSPE